MSYALETKKRKFARALESISKPLTSDGNAKAAKDPIAAARERLADPPSIKRVRVGDARGDGESAKTTVSRILRGSSSSPNVRPNFVPWDRERFLERLETFRPVTRWSSKPAPINEVEWAKRGWSCTDYMRVACVGGCGSTLVVKLPDETDDFEDLDTEKVQERKDVREKVVEEYRKMISDGHKENCPWRNKACDATIHRLPLSNAENAIAALRERYLKISNIENQLPSRDTIELPEQVSLADIISVMPPDFLSGHTNSGKQVQNKSPVEKVNNQENHEQNIDERVFAFALFGWDVVRDGSNGLLECRACFRRLGLWLYQPKDGKEAVYEKLAVHGEHMEYCPWIDGKAQSGTGRQTEKPEDLLSGWQVLTQNIQTKHRRHIKSTTGTAESTPRDSDASSLDLTAADEAAQKAKDREWWSKLRRMRDVLHVKGPRKSISEKKH
ncbi:C3HC zinc finger-like-domain-containing protein [Talaromyces proteolyticus]|uniref:C3HC zinc finger-like-domain-containing protein n=1 Tax=Talaromyces proteolyticus TaxID=1131652 RepID=A0AAD4L6T9_9EURO|nr:C3HC zinc finger-like-domain-containing protein [Talaromyces proteolyticus]KAH8705019.1 C3HC zinc finger-like-domain-containing protein [Talaromyces proteolyticus]